MMWIPMLTMPTEDELRESSAGWLTIAGPCLIDNWPNDLLALSASTTFIDLPQDCEPLLEHRSFEEFAAPIAAEIDAKIGWDHRFFRLNSRSPKDAPWPLELPVSCSGKEIMGVLAASMRTADDLMRFKYALARPKLCLREFWRDVRPAWEYRCFLRDGQVLAVAEYANDPRRLWPAPGSDADESLREEIDRYLREIILPRLHIKTVVVDLCDGHEGLRLLEINPFGYSDPVGAQSYEAIEKGIPGIARLPRAADTGEREG